MSYSSQGRSWEELTRDLLNTHTGKVTVRLTTSSEAADAESLVSDALIRKKAWVHVARLYAKVQ